MFRFCIATLVVPLLAQLAAGADRPNVVLILADDKCDGLARLLG